MTEIGYFENLWAFWLLIPAFALVFYEAFFRKRPLYIVFVRSVWILALILLVADWRNIISREFSQASLVRVFFDQSDSVRLIPERQKRVEEFYQEIREWADRENQPIEYFVFSRDVFPTSGKDLPPVPYSDYTSISAISSLPLTEGSMVIVSDGNFSLHTNFAQPVYTIQIGSENEKDLWIEDFPSVFTAFLKNRVDLPLRLGQRGFDGEKVKLELRRGSEVLQSLEIELEGSRTEVELSYFPEKMGEEVLEVYLHPLESELSELNNRASTRLRTVRDKIRILHVCGKPGLDLKAWRLFLTRQPDVDLVSFYILRSLEDDPEARNTELSLIPFPYEDLFTVELEKFDIVILQNFNFNLYFQPFYLRNLAKFVESGGALLMMGGDQSFQHYRGSPLEALFPFQFSGSGMFNFGNFQAELLKNHPIVEGLATIFQEPEWNSRHQLSISPLAETLVRYRDGVPFLSFRNVGEGRVLTLNTDESWKLQFKRIGDYIPFGRLARRILQFLTFDPEMESKRVISSPWKVGEQVNIRSSQNEVADWKIRKGDQLWEFHDESQVSWLVPEPGVYEVSISSFPDLFRFETEEKPWLNEWKFLIGNSSNLQSIANSTRAEFFSYEDRTRIFQRSLSGRQVISAETKSWSQFSSLFSWVTLIAILSFVCLDFFLRKKHHWDA